MADDFSTMQTQENNEMLRSMTADMKQGQRALLRPLMEQIETPDVGQQMQAGREAAQRGVEQYDMQAQSQYEMRLREARQRVQAAQDASEGETSQQIADREFLANHLAMPYKVIASAQADAHKEYVIRKLSDDEWMAQWAGASEKNATYARDYLDTVVDFFKGAPEWGNDLMHWLAFDSGKAVERFGYNLTEGAAQANKAFVDFGRMLADNVGLTSASQYLGELSKGLERYRNLAEQQGVGRAKEDKAGMLWDEFVKSVPQQLWNLAGLALFKRPIPGTLKLGTGGVVGAEAAMAANPLLAKQAGSGLAGMGVMGAQIAGGSYGELREQGVSPEIAGIAAVGNAMMQAPFEKFGLESFVDIFKAKGMREALYKALGSIFAEGATEYIQKWPEYLAHTWAQSELHGRTALERANWFVGSLFDWKNIAQAHDEAMLEAAVGAMWGGLGGGIRIAMTRQQQERARQFADFLFTARQHVQQAVQNGMPPDVVKSMVEAAQPLMASTAYVDAEQALTLYQSGNEAVLDGLGISEEELARLADEGGAVPIQLSDLVTRVDDATFDALYQHASIRPGSMNAAEAGAAPEQNPYTRSALAAARRQANKIPGVSTELSRMYHELLDLGLSRQQARDNVTLLAVQAATLQAKGFDALSWLQRRKYVVGEDGQTYTVPVGLPQTENAELVSEDLRSQIASSTDSEWLSKLYFGNQQMLDTYAKGTELRGADAQERDRLQAVNAMVTARLAMLNELEQRGWHGSPHDTFERFDDEAIGTGEGNATHGHGHYVAEDRDISDDRYRRRLLRWSAQAGERRAMVDGQEHAALTEAMRKDRAVFDAVFDRDADSLRTIAERTDRQAATMEDAAQKLDVARGSLEAFEGSRYEGELRPKYIKRDDLYELLERAGVPSYELSDIVDRVWEKAGARGDDFLRPKALALAALEEEVAKSREEASKVRERARAISGIDYGKADVRLDTEGQLYEVEIPEEHEMLQEEDYLDEQPEIVQDALQRLAEKHGIELDEEETTGGDAYWRLVDALGSKKAASDALRAEGVKGISYVGETDGHAWVVFKGADIQIVQTYFQGPGPKVDAPVVGAPTLYQVQNLPEWKDRLRKWGEDNSIEKAKIESFIAGIEGQMKLIESLQTKDGLNLSDAIMREVVGAGQANRKKKSGGVAYSGPVRSNADEIYLISFDASSMCVKRLSAAKTAQEAQKELGRPLTVDEQLALIALYRAEGKEAPCIYCYVESNRRKATQAVGVARDILSGTTKLPERWGKQRKEKAQAAIDEFKAAGLTREDVIADYVLDPAVGSTEEALAVKEKYPAIYDFMNSEALATKQNQVKLYEEYSGNLLDMTPEQVEMLNGYAGIRFFSSSDFQVEHMVDLMQAFTDMAAMGAKSHAYTKVPLYVDIFGDTGQKINLSCFAEEDPETGEIRPDVAQGWDWEKAKEMRAAHPDCGVVLVASSDKILRWAMQQDWIDYIIPFHYFGLEKKYYETLGWQDFTSIQMETKIKGFKKKKGQQDDENELIGKNVGWPKVYELEREKTTAEASVEYAQMCFDRQTYPVKVEYVFTDLANDASLKSNKRRDLARERWAAMVESKKFDASQINPEYFRERLTAGKTTKDKPMRPNGIKRVRMHEVTNPNNEKDIRGVSDEQGTRTYLEICKERGLYPVFTNFCFKEEVFAELHAKYADELNKAKTKEDKAKVIAKRRREEIKLAKDLWKEMVLKDSIDWDKIDLHAFKFKKDYARTDTDFNVVDPSKIHMDKAAEPLRETISQGLDSKYQADAGIVKKLVTLARWGEANNKAIGQPALAAARAKKDPMSAIMGGPAYPTAYRRPNLTEGVTLNQSAIHTPERSLETVRQQYAGTDSWMKAPNGKPTKLNERQWIQVRTPEFKAWFGDWENDPANASKILDENGEPKVLYHGGQDDIESFERGANRGEYGLAYFTDSAEDVATRYAMAGGIDLDMSVDETITTGADQEIEGRITPVFLSIKKPITENISWKEIIDAVGFDDILYFLQSNDPDAVEDFDGDETDLENILESIDFTEWGKTAGESSLSFSGNSKLSFLYFTGFFERLEKDFDGVYYWDEEAGGRTAIIKKPSQAKSAIGNAGTFNPDKPNILYQSQVDADTARLDAEYMDAVNAGDMDKARAMVEARAREMGFDNAIPEHSDSYHIRTKPAPKKTKKAYKVFYVNPQTGAPTALFVGGAEDLPVGTWLDANDQWHFTASNGKEYVPSTKNPNRTDLSGKKKNKTTGRAVPIPSDPAVRQYLLEHGFITEKSKSVTGLAYRPGWHAGTLPFFPQGGKKQEGSNYGNVHEHNQVVFEIEIAADTDWTEFARSQDKAKNKDGTINNRNADLQQLPTDGFYTYTTNPILDPKEGAWVISDSIKIVRALSQEEADNILKENGKLPQEWEQGQLNLEDYGLDTEERSDEMRKTLAPVTYDEQGNVIPLSKRFDASNPSVLYAGGASSPRGSYTRTVQGEDLIRIFQGHDASTVQHESAHAYHQLLEDMAADDGTAARQACMDALVKTGMLEGVAEQYAGLPVEELGQVIADLQAQAVQLDESMNAEGADKEGIKQEKQGILAQIDALTQLQRHYVAVEQARQDLRTIREWAGVPVEGALTREQYIQVQEQFARGFEGYLATGKSPTTALAGVFARFKQWLLAVYKNIRDYVGADITPEIKDVYDRMLATEEEMQADEVAQAMLGEMPDAIAMLGCNASDYAFLEDLLTRAHMAATSRVDKERNRDRKRRFKAAKEQALTDLLDTPLWRLATGGYGIINYESLKEFLGDKDANELRKKLPKVIRSGDGSTIDVIAMGFEGDGQMAAQFSGNADDLAQMLYEHIVLNGETLNGEATALANQALESQDSEYSVEDGFLAGDEYGDFLDALEDEAAKLQRRASAKGKKKAEARAEAAEQKAEEAQAEAEAKAKAKAEREAKLAGVRAERKALWAEYQRRAKVELDATPVGQIDPKRYAAMLRKALKGKDNAILSRDPDKAVEAVRKARYAYALMREAKRRRDMVERNLTMVEKLCRRKPGDITPIPATALHRLLQAYGFRVPKRWGGDPAHENDTMQALAAACIAEAQGEDTVEVTPDLAEWVMQEAVPDYAQDASWQSLTWADYNDLMDVFNFFVHSSKEQSKNSKDSMKARVEFLVEQAVQSMQGMQTQTSAAKGTWRRAWQNTWRRIFGAIQALQWQFRKADGFKNAGPKGEAGALESLVMRPILEGENEFRARMKELSALLAEPLEKLRQTGLRLQTELGNKHGELIKLGVKLPDDLARSEGRSSWTTDQVIALALNCGNSGNRQRITGGYPDLNYNTLAAIVGSDLAAQICQDNDIAVPEGAVYQSGIFTADDWAAVQAVWDAIETLWEPTVKVHRSMYGFAPRRVDVEPMTFRAQGAPVALRGGYYPIYYDKDISLEAQSWGERDDIMSTTESFFPAPAAKRGHTKSRQAKTKHPLRLSTSTLMDHVQDALKLICFGEAVRFADKVTKHPVFAAEYARVFGQEDYKAIRPNLKGVVRSEPAPKDAMIKLANATRKYLVSAGLWGNLKVAILQTTALGPAMGDLGAVPVWQAMGRVATGGWGLIREIQQASPYMMSRWRAFDQDLLDKAQSLDINKRPRTVKIGTKEYSWDDVVNMGMTPLCLVDLVTSGAIWQAAYSKYMKGKGLPGSLDQGSQYHAEAVQFADEEVKKSNPDFDASSRSAFLRAQNSYRLFNAFGSAVTLMAQRGEYMLQAMKHKRITKAQFARWEAYEMLAPAVAMTLIMALARGIVGGGDDDDKKLRDLFLESLLDQYSMKVPFFGSIIESTIESAAGISNSGRQPTMRTVVDTPINIFYRVPTAAVKAWDGDDEAKKKLAYAVGDLASFFARVPASKLIRNAERGYDQWERGEGTPASMLMPAPGK